jgi:hypothetical protein
VRERRATGPAGGSGAGAWRNAKSLRVLEKWGFTVVGRDKVAGDGDEDIHEESLRLD